jgi:hypothetical protein
MNGGAVAHPALRDKPAVSPISKSAGVPVLHDLRAWKPAIQPTWKSALQLNSL